MTRPRWSGPAAWAQRYSATDAQAGFTLVELLVAMVLFGLLGSVCLQVVYSTRNAATNTHRADDINAEARTALNRMARELRQAKEIDAVSAPDGATSITFGADFNGNGVIEPNAVDPEVLTYTYDAANRRITVAANDPAGTPVVRPILAADVTSFRLTYYSSLYQYDGTPVNGVVHSGDGTTWDELDAAGGAVGDKNGVLDAPELRNIDSIGIDLTVLEGPATQHYRTRVDLRNVGVGAGS